MERKEGYLTIDDEIKILMNSEAYRNPKNSHDPEYLAIKRRVDTYYQDKESQIKQAAGSFSLGGDDERHIKALMESEAYRNPKSKNDKAYLDIKARIDAFYSRKAAANMAAKDAAQAEIAKRMS